MKGFVQNTEGLAVKNDEFRRVRYTARHCPAESSGRVVHHTRHEAEADIEHFDGKTTE